MADMTFDAPDKVNSIESMGRWRRPRFTLLVPDHDLPVICSTGKPMFIGTPQVTIESWFEDALEKAMRFELVLLS